MCMRVQNHIVLDTKSSARTVIITVDGKNIEAVEGEVILAALIAKGIIINRYTVKNREARGLFCAIGQCTDCAMIVDGKPNVRTCIVPVKEGMVIETQRGLGRIGG